MEQKTQAHVSTHRRDFNIPGFTATSVTPDRIAGLSTKKQECQLVYGSGTKYEVAFSGYKKQTSLLMPYAEFYKRQGVQRYRDDPSMHPEWSQSEDQRMISKQVEANLTIPIARAGCIPSFGGYRSR